MNWKTWKMGKHFPVGEESGNFEQTEKVREFYLKYWKMRDFHPKKNWKNEGFLLKILEKLGIFSQFLFYFFSEFLLGVYVLNKFCIC